MKFIILLVIFLLQTNFVSADTTEKTEEKLPYIEMGGVSPKEEATTQDIETKVPELELIEINCNYLKLQYSSLEKFKNINDLLKLSNFYIENQENFEKCDQWVLNPYGDLWLEGIKLFDNKKYTDFIRIANHLEENYEIDSTYSGKLGNVYLLGLGVKKDLFKAKKYIDGSDIILEKEPSLAEYYLLTNDYNNLESLIFKSEFLVYHKQIQKYFDAIPKFSSWKYMGKNSENFLFISKNIKRKIFNVELWEYIVRIQNGETPINSVKYYQIFNCKEKETTTKIYKEIDRNGNILSSHNYDKAEPYPIDPDSFDANVFDEVCKKK